MIYIYLQSFHINRAPQSRIGSLHDTYRVLTRVPFATKQYPVSFVGEFRWELFSPVSSDAKSLSFPSHGDLQTHTDGRTPDGLIWGLNLKPLYLDFVAIVNPTSVTYIYHISTEDRPGMSM